MKIDGSCHCGAIRSPIYATSLGDGPKGYGLRVGTIRQRQKRQPARQFWRRSALSWVPDMDDLETQTGRDRQRPAVTLPDI